MPESTDPSDLEFWVDRLDRNFELYKVLRRSPSPVERHMARLAFLQAQYALEVVDYELTGNPEIP